MNLECIARELAAPLPADDREDLERRRGAYEVLAVALKAMDLRDEEPSLPPSLEERP